MGPPLFGGVGLGLPGRDPIVQELVGLGWVQDEASIVKSQS